MKKLLSLLFVVMLLLASVGCGSIEPSADVATPGQSPEESILVPIAYEIDYVDVRRNPDKYDGEFIRVAGQITNFSLTDDYAFYFNDRLSQYEDGLGFAVELSHNRNDPHIDEVYSIGDYVVVEGIWRSRVYQDALEEASVIHTGKDAEQAAKIYLASWESERQDFALSTPILNYMEIFNDKSYDGQYIRIVGQISVAGTNGVTHYRNIRFRNPITNESIVEISLKGCPIMMQDSCVDGEYVIISGKFDIKNFSANISDCYVECVGEKAREAYDAVMFGQS